MREKEISIQDVQVTMFKMSVVQALELWDHLVKVVSKSTKDLSLDVDDLKNIGNLDVDIAKIISGAMEALGNGNILAIAKHAIKHIHIEGKKVDSVDQISVRIGEATDVLSFIDDLIIEFIRFQFEKKILNLVSKVGLVGISKETLESNSPPLTGESGE